MPNDNKPTKDDQAQVNSSMPPTVMEDVAPPIMQTTGELPKIDTKPTESEPVVPPVDTGSAAPSNDIAMPPVITTQKKKFAGGRVIATILGLFLLVGGVGAGVYLTGQNQDVREKAYDCKAECIANGGGTLVCGCECGETNSRCPAGDGNDGGGEGAIRIQCGTTPNGCTTSIWSNGSTTCDEALRQECNFEPVRGANYREAVNGQCPSGFTSATCNCGGTSVCFDRGFDNQCNTTDGLCAVYNNSEASGGENGVACGTTTTYYCGSNVDLSGGKSCDTSTGGTTTRPAGFCGIIQEDVACQGFKTTVIPCDENGQSETLTASCQNVKAYSSTWTLLTSTQLSALRTGNSVNFCVTGALTGGSFNKARFTINSVLQPETTTVRPGSTDFCQTYTIPAGTTTFNVSAQINHNTLGWK